jgi:hypothetical protein
MLSLSAYLRHTCFAAALCAYLPLVQAEEIQSEGVSKTELVFEADPYYTNMGYNVPLTDKPIPTITSDNEAVIYRDLIEGSLIPRYMVLEASVYPLASLGTVIKSRSPDLYRQGEIGHSGINLFESRNLGRYRRSSATWRN